MNKNRQILIFENSYTLTNYLTKYWIEAAHRSIEDHNRFCVALSGGRTPTEIYVRLSTVKDDGLWGKTHIFWADEHFVSHEDKDSHFRMVKESLLDYIGIPWHNIHPINTSYENVLICAEDYKNSLLYFFDIKDRKPPRFDLILLGLGLNGEVASLHPHKEWINDPNRFTIPVITPFYKNERVSLTLNVINRARNIVVVVQGSVKAEIVRKIFEEKIEVPASLIQPEDGVLFFLLDKEAASQLSLKGHYTDQGQAVSVSYE